MQVTADVSLVEPLPAVDDDVAPSAPRRRRRVWRALARLVVLAVIGTTATMLVHNAFASVDRDGTRVRGQLAASRGRLAQLGDDLAAATGQRAAAEQLEARTNALLVQARAVHAARSRELATARALLDALARTTAVSLHEQQLQNSRLAALHTCLDGVSAALNYIGIGDTPHASDVLASVDADCRAAETTS